MKTIERMALVIALVLAALGLLLPSQFQPAPTVAGSQALTFGTSNFGGSIDVAGNARIVGSITGASLTISGVSESGPMRYGTQSNVISGTTIAHGMGTTPTMFSIADEGPHSTYYSQTLYHHACNVTSCTVGVTAGSVATFTVDWIAGR